MYLSSGGTRGLPIVTLFLSKLSCGFMDRLMFICVLTCTFDVIKYCWPNLLHWKNGTGCWMLGSNTTFASSHTAVKLHASHQGKKENTELFVSVTCSPTLLISCCNIGSNVNLNHRSKSQCCSFIIHRCTLN